MTDGPHAAGPGPRGAKALAALTLAFVVASVVWTVVSAATLSTTFDEPHHLATGLAWWQFGSYRWWTENPPLAKVLTALGPYLAGVRLPANPSTLGPYPWGAGIELLEHGGPRVLLLARLGTIPFLLLALWFTFLLAGGRKRIVPAFLATALVATYPPLLGHAGLATTDLAAVATVLGFLLAFDRWADAPSRGRAVVLGAALALASLCKLTAPPLCALLGLAWLCGRRWCHGSWFGRPVPRRELLGQMALALLSVSVVVWAGYRFSFGRIEDLPPMAYMDTPVLPPVGQRSGFLGWVVRQSLPAPELWHGFLFLQAHDAHGHLAYLFGETREHGFRSFYFVGLLLKSPLPFLLLLAAAIATRVRRGGARSLGAEGLCALLAALTALLFSMIVRVNIGLRHMLIVVPLLAIFVATALDPWLTAGAPRRRAIASGLVVVLLLLQIVVVQRARPELMAYFNPIAGREPGRALIDSDLDWGQDLVLLQRELAARRIASLHYALFAIVNPCDHAMPEMLPLEPQRPTTGWIVLSEQFHRSGLHFSFRRSSCAPQAHYAFHEDPPGSFDWLKEHEPVARIGASLRLYHVGEPGR